MYIKNIIKHVILCNGTRQILYMFSTLEASAPHCYGFLFSLQTLAGIYLRFFATRVHSVQNSRGTVQKQGTYE
jgi:hypothetical protein